MTNEENIYDVAIIGAGPAGFTAGIYTSRAELSTILFEGNQPGGQLTTTTEVENFPGFKEGISGAELTDLMRQQAVRFGTKDVFEEVTDIDFSQRPFTITTNNQTYKAKTVIIATGARAKYLGLENEQRLVGRGVSACATCDGFFFQNKNVAVVGGGDTAMGEALFLAKFAKRVTVINRTTDFKASSIMVKRVKKKKKITILTDVEVADIKGEQKVEELVLKNTQTQQEQTIPMDGLFVAIGRQPNTDFLKGKIDLSDYQLIETKPDTAKTNIKGVFAAGDVADTQMYWQAIIAAGSGCKSALDAQRLLEEEE